MGALYSASEGRCIKDGVAVPSNFTWQSDDLTYQHSSDLTVSSTAVTTDGSIMGILSSQYEVQRGDLIALDLSSSASNPSHFVQFSALSSDGIYEVDAQMDLSKAVSSNHTPGLRIHVETQEEARIYHNYTEFGDFRVPITADNGLLTAAMQWAFDIEVQQVISNMTCDCPDACE